MEPGTDKTTLAPFGVGLASPMGRQRRHGTVRYLLGRTEALTTDWASPVNVAVNENPASH